MVRDELTLAYVREGVGGTPLLLLHGYPETKRIWWRNIAPLAAAERVLTLSFGNDVHRLTAEELLARPDATSITIPDDVSYHRAITYRAVPLIALIGDVAKLGFDTIEARASDGFVSQIPASLAMGGASGVACNS